MLISFWPEGLPWLTLLIVAATIAGIAMGRWPLLRADRTTVTVIGAALLLAIGAISLEEAFAAVDLDTILLLFSMMVINGCLFLAGFFGAVSRRLVLVARSPAALLAVIILASGVLSALFLNDTIVLMLTPIVLETTLALRRNPVPYLLGVALAANVGSTATITGNPQNIIIGSLSGIPYTSFLAALGPTALIGIVICWVVLVLTYREEFRATRLFTLLAPLAQAGLVPFGLIAVVLSNLVSNVPAVLLLQGLVPAFPDPERAWLMLAATATLAGNLTLLGSVANLIMAELAGRWGVRITFRAYLQVGVPVTALTVLVALLLV